MFRDLKVDELRRAAAEDFALELKPNERSKEAVLAAFTEAGITFEHYLSANPHLRAQYEPAEPVVETVAVVTEPVQQNIVTAQPVSTTNDVYLVKKTRENPLYEIVGTVTRKTYTWTDEHPYALVDSLDADDVLEEEGFRQAKPSELTEYYS